MSGGLAAACCFIRADTASAFHRFTAIWTYAIAVVDKISAVHATRLILFLHHFASASSSSAETSALSFRKVTTQLIYTKKERRK